MVSFTCDGKAADTYPFLWFFFDWLCWDEFFDSARFHQQSSRDPLGRRNILAMATDL